MKDFKEVRKEFKRKARQHKQKMANILKAQKVRTSAELQMESVLDSLAIRYLPEHTFVESIKTFYLADFYIPKPYRAVIEIDGGYHEDEAAYDKEKNLYYIHKAKVSVIRFTNEEVFSDIKNEVMMLLEKSRDGPTILRQSYHKPKEM